MQDGIILTPPEGRSRCLTNATFRCWLFCHHFHHHHHHHESNRHHISHAACNTRLRATTEVYPDSPVVTAEQCNRSSNNPKSKHETPSKNQILFPQSSSCCRHVWSRFHPPRARLTSHEARYHAIAVVDSKQHAVCNNINQQTSKKCIAD